MKEQGESGYTQPAGRRPDRNQPARNQPARNQSIRPGPVAGDRLDRRTFSSWPLLATVGAAFSGLFGLAAMMIDVLFEGSATFSTGTAVVMFAAFVGFLVVVGIVRRDMDIAPD